MLPEEIVGKVNAADLQFVSQPTPASNESKNNNGEINSTSSSSSTQPSSLLAASVDSTNNENISATATAAKSAYTGIIVGGQKIFAPPSSSSSRPTSSSSSSFGICSSMAHTRGLCQACPLTGPNQKNGKIPVLGRRKTYTKKVVKKWSPPKGSRPKKNPNLAK